MVKNRIIFLAILVLFLLFSAGLVFSQDELPDVQWVWGEVVKVDPANNEIVIKYIDYDSDSEKELPIFIGENTIYENVASLQDIKEKDGVSVDYVISADGKNIAKNIGVEKPEQGQAEFEAGEAVPEEVQDSP